MSRPINKVGLALIRDKRLLLARNRGAAVFQIPGGKVEPHDTDDAAALVREIREELGLDLNRGALNFLGLFSAEAAGKPGQLVTVKLYRTEVAGVPAPQSEIEALIWLDPFVSDPPAMSDVVKTKILPFVRDMIAATSAQDAPS